ncbi:MAG: protein translocase subunit SecF [Halothiobacillus sp. 14-56-357]|jgi:preprotein translocase subunit SecF|uniref:protein translocase subunit SecF n=1 Tax=Halothiobacillus sp. 15-55-196 TaxID=1970382 RepID=UPI000BD4FB5B|nr:protein translocase subunit SecF [Halothiobacillus sp. 15-55-196]OZB36945.1 MAG: protein translocase subunit SecF [Halothiobacillus sp. 15-55-196]OZB56663.1 MAG: protein translocase subunit SecF [Halothiobacillus sp. 14-56-357]OZB78897.1 MAG: protein translocase subunit SecF [Halothiobacillus sp. 13-55-115]
MFNLFPYNAKFDFFGKRKYAYIISALLLIAAIVSLSTRGINLGLDFTGGVVLEVGYSKAADLDAIRADLKKNDFKEAVVQYFGSSETVMIRLPPAKGQNQNQLADKVLSVLKKQDDSATMRRVEFVGPAVGKELFNSGGLAMIVVLSGLLIFVSLRYQLKMATGAVLTLSHDLIMVFGFISFTGIEFNLTVLAAYLALAGYSINDMIVVFDRMRENFRKIRKGSEIEIMNASVNQTMSRTVITATTTFLSVLALYVFGGEALRGFSETLLVGIVLGTFSSIYVASSLSLDLGLKRKDLLKLTDKEKLVDTAP